MRTTQFHPRGRDRGVAIDAVAYKVCQKRNECMGLQHLRSAMCVACTAQLEDGSWEMLVEPRVTMEQLVRAAAAYNLRPPVVPEFRRITVGGSIAGIAGIRDTEFRV